MGVAPKNSINTIIMTFCLKFLLMAFIASITIANCSVLEILGDPKSRCPKYWVDATHVDMGCLLFNATEAMSWHAAQSFCKSEPAYSSHLVEIFNQDQQDFLPWGVWQPDGGDKANFGAMFAGFDYRWTDETSPFEYRGGAHPICQFS